MPGARGADAFRVLAGQFMTMPIARWEAANSYLTALVGTVIADNIGCAIGFFGGRVVVLRFGKYVMLTTERLRRAEGFFDRYGGNVAASLAS